jgi:hypothetical protein
LLGDPANAASIVTHLDPGQTVGLDRSADLNQSGTVGQSSQDRLIRARPGSEVEAATAGPRHLNC